MIETPKFVQGLLEYRDQLELKVFFHKVTNACKLTGKKLTEAERTKIEEEVYRFGEGGETIALETLVWIKVLSTQEPATEPRWTLCSDAASMEPDDSLKPFACFMNKSTELKQYFSIPVSRTFKTQFAVTRDASGKTVASELYKAVMKEKGEALERQRRIRQNTQPRSPLPAATAAAAVASSSSFTASISAAAVAAAAGYQNAYVSATASMAAAAAGVAAAAAAAASSSSSSNDEVAAMLRMYAREDARSSGIRPSHSLS
jgi:hypothetical protein